MSRPYQFQPQDDDDATDQEAPEMPMAFDSEGRPIKVTHPIFETMDEDEDATRHSNARGEIVAGLMRMLTHNADAAKAGQRLLVVAYLSGAIPECKTHRDLAARLNISPGRVSQIINDLRAIMPSLAVCNSRQRRSVKARRTYGDATTNPPA